MDTRCQKNGENYENDSNPQLTFRQILCGKLKVLTGNLELMVAKALRTVVDLTFGHHTRNRQHACIHM